MPRTPLAKLAAPTRPFADTRRAWSFCSTGRPLHYKRRSLRRLPMLRARDFALRELRWSERRSLSKRESAMTDYHINAFFNDKDDCYVADIPDLKYCSAVGE